MGFEKKVEVGGAGIVTLGQAGTLTAGMGKLVAQEASDGPLAEGGGIPEIGASE